MGILDASGLLKLPEHLLNKGDINKAFTERFSKINVIETNVGLSIDHLIPKDKINPILANVRLAESNVMSIGSLSRIQYMDVVKNQRPEQEDESK